MSGNKNILALNEWFLAKKEPLIISGPCSAESEKQVVDTALELKKLGCVSVFRAGVWKPRTRPGSFEGKGSIAFEWLKKVKQELGFLITTEVANAQHVEEALKNNIDILWIGARTTVNPFYVQEIADALKGIDIPVIIKNPVNPDIGLWAGAIERINKSGITKIIAAHRGFFSFEKTPYRNPPQWQLPIELKTLFPKLPLVCDPSHICGNAHMLADVSQKALDLDMDGLMIESHINPALALSDADQQITPEELGKILASLVYRKKSTQNSDFHTKLEQLRSIIDEIDSELLSILSRRMQLVEKIGEYKRDNNITVLQLERWMEILRTRAFSGNTLGLDEDFLKKLLTLVHKESIRIQTDIMNSDAENIERLNKDSSKGI